MSVCYHLPDVTCGNCRSKLGYPPSAQYGWICPKCGSSFAPLVWECRYCNSQKPAGQKDGDAILKQLAYDPNRHGNTDVPK